VKINFFNTYINITNIEEQKKALSNSLRKNNKTVFYYLNSYSFYLTEKFPHFREAFNSADYITADGMSIVWGIRIINGVKIEKVTHNHSFFEYLAEEYSKRGVSIYLLGSENKLLERAVENLNQKHPGLKISGYQNGYFEESESTRIIETINKAKPGVLFVGMGMPKSELWIHNHYELFDDYVIMTVGNLIDIFAGKVKLAPKFLHSSGFEWTYRLLHEPRRLFKRYLLANGYTIYKIFSKKIL